MDSGRRIPPVLARVALIAISIAFGQGVAVSAEDRRPNFVLILADELGYGDIGAFRELR